MSGIDGLKKIAGGRGLDGVGAVEGPAASGHLEGPAPVKRADATDPLVALFEQVAVRLSEGALADRGAAVREAVGSVLAKEMPHLPQEVRAGLVGQVAAALELDPGLSQRLDRLLARPA